MVYGVRSIFSSVEVNKTTELISLWSVCGLSILSASTGIQLGIRRMSQLCFLTSMVSNETLKDYNLEKFWSFIRRIETLINIFHLHFFSGALFTIPIALSDDVFYLLNLSVQSIGIYFQYFISSSTYTSAILQKGNYPGSKTEEIEWMYKNTIFYCKIVFGIRSFKFKKLTNFAFFITQQF